jgi:hypothetical protein
LAIYQFCKGGILDLKKEYNGEMINVIVMRDEGIVVAEPTGPLEHTDFEKLAKEIDAYSDDRSRLSGLIIHTKNFFQDGMILMPSFSI